MEIFRNPNMYYNVMKLQETQKEFIVFDLETTGLDSKQDRIIQIAAIKYHFVDKNTFEEIDTLNLYIKPDFPIPQKIEKLTGITNQKIKDAPLESDIFPTIFHFFKNTPVIAGYNICNFDIKFMKELYLRYNEIFHPINELDVLYMARDFTPYKECKGYKLSVITSYYGLSDDLTFHDAMDDVKATSRLLRVFFTQYIEDYHFSFKGKVRPKVLSFFTWQGKRHDLKRLYVCTNIGNFYYDLARYSWGAKDINMDTIDLPFLTLQVYKYGNVLNDDDLYYWAKTQFSKK